MARSSLLIPTPDLLESKLATRRPCDILGTGCRVSSKWRISPRRGRKASGTEPFRCRKNRKPKCPIVAVLFKTLKVDKVERFCRHRHTKSSRRLWLFFADWVLWVGRKSSCSGLDQSISGGRGAPLRAQRSTIWDSEPRRLAPYPAVLAAIHKVIFCPAIDRFSGLKKYRRPLILKNFLVAY
jgi:hypothetical protein